VVRAGKPAKETADGIMTDHRRHTLEERTKHFEGETVPSLFLRCHPLAASTSLHLDFPRTQSRLRIAAMFAAFTESAFSFRVGRNPVAAYAAVLCLPSLFRPELLELLERYKEKLVNPCAFTCADLVEWVIDRHTHETAVSYSRMTSVRGAT
jgi:hypothetical protein